jgi:uncharacterized protein YkwD
MTRERRPQSTASKLVSRRRLRGGLAAALVLVVSVAAPLASASSRSSRLHVPELLPSLEIRTLDDINRVRAAYGLHALSLNQALSQAATVHSREMLADGFFGHESANGSGFAARVADYYPVGGAARYSVGENLLWISGPVDASGIVTRWMQSPHHRANLLSPDWRQLGIAVVTVGSAPGIYEGRSTTVITADFGVRD